VVFQINDMGFTPRLASAAAATVITAVMLVCVGIGFAAPVVAAPADGVVRLAATSVVMQFE
jgi:hypothetical protein